MIDKIVGPVFNCKLWFEKEKYFFLPRKKQKPKLSVGAANKVFFERLAQRHFFAPDWSFLSFKI